MDTSHFAPLTCRVRSRSAWLTALFTVSIVQGGFADEFGVPITSPIVANTNASTDTGSDRVPHLACDGAGHWIAVWQSNENLGRMIGNDNDILKSCSSLRRG